MHEAMKYFSGAHKCIFKLPHGISLLQLIGTPNEADLDFVNENARRYIRQLPRHASQSLSEKFPHVHPSAIDLVEKMLTFDPRQRITGKFWHVFFRFNRPIHLWYGARALFTYFCHQDS
jgi:serine/threonine protein kinase